MSRHRNVRNLDIDDVLAEDDYSEEEYDQAAGGAFDLSEMTEDDRAAMDDGVAHVYSVIGDDTSVSLQTIQETLWYYYFDKEETVNFLLDMIAKQKSAQAKEASKAAKGGDINRAIRKRRLALLASLPDNQRHNGRPITLPKSRTASSLSSIGLVSNRLRQTRAAGSSLSSLRMKIASQKPASTGLNALSNTTVEHNAFDQKVEQNGVNEKKPAASSNSRPSTLSSLAQQSKGKDGSALQRLAARPKPEKHESKQSASRAVPQTSNVTNSTSSTSALAKLAQRHQNKPSAKNLSDLVKTSRLKTATTSSDDKSSLPKEVGQILGKPPSKARTFQQDGGSAILPVSTKKNVDTRDTRHTRTEPFTNHQIEPSMTLDPSYLDHPLCASPSSVANFLFTPLTPIIDRLDMSQLSMSTASKSLNATIYQNMMPSNKNVKVFKFDAPSPDDTVRSAQSQRKRVVSKVTA